MQIYRIVFTQILNEYYDIVKKNNKAFRRINKPMVGY